jgi:hypothetical protein
MSKSSSINLMNSRIIAASLRTQDWRGFWFLFLIKPRDTLMPLLECTIGVLRETMHGKEFCGHYLSLGTILQIASLICVRMAGTEESKRYSAA